MGKPYVPPSLPSQMISQHSNRKRVIVELCKRLHLSSVCVENENDVSATPRISSLHMLPLCTPSLPHPSLDVPWASMGTLSQHPRCFHSPPDNTLLHLYQKYPFSQRHRHRGLKRIIWPFAEINKVNHISWTLRPWTKWGQQDFTPGLVFFI